MASMPTAYASQRFGQKTLDFYAASGAVIGSDPRARADERRLEDMDGARHTIRLSDPGFALEPGDQASVLRMQPGPARRSRPVAVVNHSRNAWTRTHPGVGPLLARAGVARGLNWALTLVALAAAALAAVWPFLRTFLVEVDPSAFSRAPAFDIFALAAASVPALADLRIADLVAPLAAPVSQWAPALSGFEAITIYALAALSGGVFVFSARSWRLIWVPVLIAGLGALSMGFAGAAGAVAPFLAGLGVVACVFLAGGMLNSVRDAIRLERRIAVLADHIRTHAPEENVGRGEPGAIDEEIGASADAEAAGDAETVEVAPHAEPEAEDRARALTLPGAAIAASLRQKETDELEGLASRDPSGDGGDAAAAQAEPADAAEDGQADIGLDDAPAALEDNEPAISPEEPDIDAPAAQTDPDRDPQPANSDRPGSDSDPQAMLDEAAASDGVETEPGPGADTGLDPQPASTFDADESERLRTDPRYAARAIVLPPPPPMPGAAQTGPQEAQDDASSAAGQTRTLRPSAPLPTNVVPIFGGARPAPLSEAPSPKPDSDGEDR